MKKIKFFLIIGIVILVLINVNVVSTGDVIKNIVSVSNTTRGVILEKSGNGTSISEGAFQPVKTISVKYTQAEIDEIENQEIINPRRPYSLGFISESFTPTQGLDERLQTKVQEFSNPNYMGKNYTYGFIMITGRVTSEKLQSITNYGIELLGYHPSHTYKAKIPLGKVNEIKDLPFVKWIGYSTLKQKLHPNLFDKITVINNEVFVNDFSKDEEIPIYINLFNNDVGSEFKNILKQKGVNVFEYNKKLLSYRAFLTPNILKEIINLDFVLAVEGEAKTIPLHDESMPSIGADYLRNSYDGSGISIGIIDSGYNENHLDLSSITTCNDYSPDNDCTIDNCNGHGTHIGGTILGRGNANSKYKGVATGVTDVIIAKIARSGCTIFTSDFLNAINWIGDIVSPPDVVSISIGTPYANCTGTDQGSRNADSNVYDDDQILVIAAGNCGPGGNAAQCSPIVPGASETILSPGCAKNIITVGSVWDSGEGIIDDVNSYSSRGPTGDGRKKPDIVAPGCGINSTDYQDNNGYKKLCGTSMATPHVSGLIATLLEHYSWLKGNTSKVKALITAKALVHGGDISNVGNTYGHGKVDSYLSHWIRDNSNGWKSGSISGEVNATTWQYYDLIVPSDADRLVVVMTWTEPAASAGASYAVINDLDLWIDKGANEASCEAGEWSSTSAHDNVEYEYINNPGGDTFRLKFCPWFINDTVSPQQFSVAYMIIRGDPTPSSTLTQVSETSVYVGEEFTTSATVEPSSYVASGVYTEINIPGGVEIVSMNTTREDGITMSYGSDSDINLGDIREGDDRTVTWMLKATSSGIKTIGTGMNSDNSGTTSTSIDVNASLRPDGMSCSADSECSSGYCDDDGVGWGDDGWCFSIESTYYDNQDSKCEESARSANDDWCDEKRNEDLNTCDKTGVTYKEDTCSNTCSISDKNNICRSSAFASGCTADSECNGIEAETGFCLSDCTYLPPTDTHKFYHKNSTGSSVAWLGNEGNIVLAGSCFSGGSCNSPGDNSFIMRNSSSDNVAFINSSGDMCVEAGDCSDNSANCNSPTGNSFIVRNSSNTNMIYFDSIGDLCLIGGLYENSNP